MSKYALLADHLRGLAVTRVQLTFTEIARLVGPLPPSAAHYRAWWANDRSHLQARVWLDAGWRVEAVTLGRSVSFAKSSSPSQPATIQETPFAHRSGPLSHPPGRGAGGEGLTAERSTTLLVLPCSSRKRGGGTPALTGRTLADDLTAELASGLKAARARNAADASVDETLLLPAFRRYAGTLYESAGDAIQQAVSAGWHIVILSGGYGLVRADEPIGDYDAVLQLHRWPREIIQRSLVAYASRYGLGTVIVLAGGSTPYAEVARRTAWRHNGLDAVLLSPDVAGGGAMVKTPRALGEALAHLLSGGLPPGWVSTDDVGLSAHQLT